MSQHDAQGYFQSILVTVVGQAFMAAGYRLDDAPVQWASGLYRFVKSTDDGGVSSVIAFQHLVYQNTEWASGQPSRFKVMLHGADGRMRDLSALVVDDFGVAILPSGKHWWTYTDTQTLGQALAEAGHLAIGYGMPWLSGDLTV